MGNPVEEILSEYSMMVIDGAMATELEAHGCYINDALWSAKVLLENPEIIKAVHRDYLQAGADCIITSSYQATLEGFQKKGLSAERAAGLIRLSVQLAREARDEFWLVHKNSKRPRPLVAASVGPYGAFLADGSEYRGHYNLDKQGLKVFHRQRLELLASEQPDLFACETIPCLDEAKALVELLADYPDNYAWISFTCCDETHISDGTLFADCAAWLDRQEQVAAIGLNCTAPQYVESLIKEAKKVTDKPLIVYPNSGESYDPVTKTWSGASKDFCEYPSKWLAAGAKLIGGCCRTNPSHIKEIAALRQKV